MASRQHQSTRLINNNITEQQEGTRRNTKCVCTPHHWNMEIKCYCSGLGASARLHDARLFVCITAYECVDMCARCAWANKCYDCDAGSSRKKRDTQCWCVGCWQQQRRKNIPIIIKIYLCRWKCVGNRLGTNADVRPRPPGNSRKKNIRQYSAANYAYMCPSYGLLMS